jgi:hypothetical protein
LYGNARDDALGLGVGNGGPVRAYSAR